MNHLRKLKKEDAPLMLEWMHDPEVADNFRVDFGSVTMEQAEEFIKNSFTDRNQHFAIMDENDSYVGTISLKNIDTTAGEAEYAIVTRRASQGKGYAHLATEELIGYAFDTLKLNRVYLNVLKENQKANHFYRKNGFEFLGEDPEKLLIKGKEHTLNLYEIRKKH